MPSISTCLNDRFPDYTLALEQSAFAHQQQGQYDASIALTRLMADGAIPKTPIVALSADGAPVTVQRRGRPLFATAAPDDMSLTLPELPPWFVAWSLESPQERH